MKEIVKNKIEAIKNLRSRGYSFPEIAQALHIAKSTAFRYGHSTPIKAKFINIWSEKRGGASKRRKLLKERLFYEEMKSLVSKLSAREKMLFISALYWAEGNKKDLILINSDPDLIRVFVNGIKDTFNISEDRFKANIRIHSDLAEDECLKFWSDITNIPISNFLKSEIIDGKKKGKLQYGMCRVRISKGGDLLKKIMSINKIVFEEFIVGM